MKTLTLNIGTQAFNGTYQLTTATIISACNHAGIKLLPPTECKQSDSELTLVSAAEYNDTDELGAVIYNLALVLDQGAIAWLDGGGVGHLTGPQAERLGAFNRDLFLFPTKEKPFDAVQFCINWENGDLSEPDIIDGFQELINSGLAWQLQGCYGRTAAALIEAGYCTKGGK